MAAPHPGLIDALRETAERLRKGSDYKWANFGLCNCGHLAQTVTHQSPKAAQISPEARGTEPHSHVDAPWREDGSLPAHAQSLWYTAGGESAALGWLHRLW